MKALCERSGVPRSTIKHYIAQGLLPKPAKTSRNMAYYDHTHLEAISAIKELQTKCFFPLSVIKEKLSKPTIEQQKALAEVDGQYFLAWQKALETDPLTIQQLHKLTGVSLKEIRELEKDGVIRPFKHDGREYFKNEDVRLVICLGEVRAVGYSQELGYTAAFMKRYMDAFERLIDEETRISLKNLVGKVSPSQMVKLAEDVMPPLETIFKIFHRRSIINTVSRHAELFRRSQDDARRPQVSIPEE